MALEIDAGLTPSRRTRSAAVRLPLSVMYSRARTRAAIRDRPVSAIMAANSASNAATTTEPRPSTSGSSGAAAGCVGVRRRAR